MSGLEWTIPKIAEVPMNNHYRALYRQALEEEPVAPWEKDAFDEAEAVLAVVEEGDSCAACIELEALIQTRRAVAATAAPDHRLEEARAVRIEDEVARRGIKLHGGNERSGPCPACGGTDRFSINVKKQLWNCRRCQRGGDVIALVRHLDGVGFEDALEALSGRPAAKRLDAKPAQPSAKRIVVSRFDYHDAHGAVAYQVERVEYQNPDGSYVLGKDGKRKKDFPQRRPDPDRPGEWIYNLGDTRRVLYRLPELIEALAYGRTVVLVEGEAKADLLWGWNIPATCSPMGAKNWRGDLYAATLRGADIVVLPDNDPDGRLYLDAAAVSLKEAGASVRVLALPGLGPKGDIINWERAGGTVEQLHALIEREARPWVPSDGHDQAGEPKGNARKTNSGGAHDGAEQWTELGNARRLVRRHGDDVRYVHSLKAWFIWDGVFWRRDDSGEIMRRAEATIESLFEESKLIADDATRQAFRKFALKSQARAQISAMVQLAQHQLRVVLSPDALDPNPMLLGVLNGTIDLNTGTFRESRREDYITKQCAVAFDPAAQCPNWSEFQNKIAAGNAELVAYKQRVFGLLLTGEMVEILFILHGDGQNGKTTELETISRVLGDYAHAANASVLLSPKERGGGATPEIVAIKGKRAVFINETDDSDHLNESRVKYLCGNDTMSGRDLFESIINFQPTHKPLLRTNYKPKIRGTDLGIWRRIHYWPYLVTIRDDEKVVKFREMKLDPERPGILNWMLAGLKDYLAGGLRPPPVVCQATKKYQREMNTVGQWIETMCEKSTIDTRLYLSEIHEKYAKWSTAEHGWAASKQKLAEGLRARGYEEDHPRNLTRFKLRLRPDEPDEAG